MPDRLLRLLLLEDSSADAEMIQTILQRSGIKFEAVVASDEQEFHAALNDDGYHAVLADNALPQYSSIEALKLLRAINPHVAFILVTGTVSEEFAVNIIQQGADDYILKTNLTRLPAAIKGAIEKKRIQKEKEAAEKEIENEKELSVSIINSLPGIFYLCDSDKKFRRWNKNFERISGYKAEEISKMTPEYFFAGKDRDFINKFIQKCFATGYGETEAVFVTKEGKKTPYYFTSKAVIFEHRECLIVVGFDISASKESENELQLLNDELRRVSAHLEDVREKEQARIAREVHDQIGQQLTGLKMDLSWIKAKLDKQPAIPEEINAKMQEMFGMLDETVVTVRKVASDLRPSILDDFGLVEALDWQSKEFSVRSGIPVIFRQPRKKLVIDPSVSTGLFRIYQELLTNIARHAGEAQVNSSLEQSADRLILTVSDNGKGFDSSRPVRSLGLLGIKERAYMIGGTIEIDSAVGKGTTIAVIVPVEQGG